MTTVPLGGGGGGGGIGADIGARRCTHLTRRRLLLLPILALAECTVALAARVAKTVERRLATPARVAVTANRLLKCGAFGLDEQRAIHVGLLVHVLRDCHLVDLSARTALGIRIVTLLRLHLVLHKAAAAAAVDRTRHARLRVGLLGVLGHPSAYVYVIPEREFR
jgi:hypothetical protein